MKLTGKKLQDYLDLTNHFRFQLFPCTYSREHRLVKRPMIAIVNTDTGVTVQLTTIADVAIYLNDTSEFTTHKQDIFTIIQLLNYIFIDHAEKYRICDLRDITLDMLQDFIYDYCNTLMPDGRYPTKRTIFSHRSTVCHFAYRLCEKYEMRSLKKEDIMHVRSYTDSNYRVKSMIEYHINVISHEQEIELKHLWRDMPAELIPKLIRTAQIYDPEMVLAITLGYRAGLREGEICSIRDEGSLFGKSILCDKLMGECRGITIDLTKDFILRPDGVETGNIKRKRRQVTYNKYVHEIYEAYRKHREIISNKPRRDTLPLFVNRKKNRSTGYYEAMTTEGYHKRMNALMKRLLPQLATDPNPVMQQFYLEMLGHSWGAHSLRHLFTVNLVVYENVDLPTLKLLRGDKSDEAAEAYLRNKGLLRNKLTETVARLFDQIILEDETE